MKNISALICEFNVLHSGHEYILSKMRESGNTVVCIMSGNFVQRGEPALNDKYIRARDALEAGADLVLELPFPWCASPAEFFALAGVTVASEIGASRLVFGSECGDMRLLEKARDISLSDVFSKLVEEEYKEEVGFAAAREKAARALDENAARIFASPNDMLALEYMKNSLKIGFYPEFECVKRREEEGYVSATDIRRAILSGDVQKVVGRTHRSAEDISRTALDPEKLYEMERIIFRLGRNDPYSFDASSGIVSRISSASRKALSGGEMLRAASTKKYTDARIRRAALFSVLSVKEDDLRRPPLFTILLGASERGRALLRSLKGDLTVVTKPSVFSNPDAVAALQYKKQKEADALYALSIGDEADAYIKKSPVIL